MGIRGVALGTAIAEWTGLVVGLLLIVQLFKKRSDRIWDLHGLWVKERLLGMFGAQFDIMLRTLLLLGGFAWFTNQGARFGDTTLAANHVLLQLVSFSAFVLDGFAFATESLVGRAHGAKDRKRFDKALKLTSELALISALLLAVGVLWVGPWAVNGITDLQSVRHTAQEFLGYAAVYVALSVAAFQLDGVFIGTTRTRDMRNASFWSLAGFLLLSAPLIDRWENTGLWLSFIGYVVLRAVTLALLLPRVRATMERD
jgi:MATE family multidrug resistance protein